MNRISAIVPVKAEQFAKQRLSGLLSEAERLRLTSLMLTDLLAALRQSTGIDRVVIVSPAEEELDPAILGAAEILPEPAGVRGLNGAIAYAAGVRAAAGDEGILILPLDLPLLTPADVDLIVAASAAAPSATIVASRDLDGTNALLVKPPTVLTFQYGPGSFRRHLSSAVEKRLTTAVLELPNVALDIDQPVDLLELIRRPGDTLTQQYLRSLDLDRREAT